MGGTKSIREIAKELGTGFKRANEKNNFIEFVEAEEKASQQKIDAIVSETNETLRKIAYEERLLAVRKERRRLSREETPSVYEVIPRVTPADLANLTNEQVTEKIKDAFRLFRERVEISRADFILLTSFLEQNSIDCTDPSVIERALQFIIDRLTLIEQGGPVLEKVAAQVDETEKNPFSWSNHERSDYCKWDRAHAQEQIVDESVVPVRGWLEEIVIHDSLDLSGENIEQLIQIMRAKNTPLTRENVRKTFLRLLGV